LCISQQSAGGAAAVDNSSSSSSSSSSNATLHAEEVASLREKLRLVQSDLTAQQERNINIIEEYQGTRHNYERSDFSTI
jgi:ribosomal protein S13